MTGEESGKLIVMYLMIIGLTILYVMDVQNATY